VQIAVLINQRVCFRIYIHMITETSFFFQSDVKSENYCIGSEKSLGNPHFSLGQTVQFWRQTWHLRRSTWKLLRCKNNITHTLNRSIPHRKHVAFIKFHASKPLIRQDLLNGVRIPFSYSLQAPEQIFLFCLLPCIIVINHLPPNGHYMGRTAQLTSRCCILYIYSTNIRTEYFKNAA